jgi:hypothetical protein
MIPRRRRYRPDARLIGPPKATRHSNLFIGVPSRVQVLAGPRNIFETRSSSAKTDGAARRGIIARAQRLNYLAEGGEDDAVILRINPAFSMSVIGSE